MCAVFHIDMSISKVFVDDDQTFAHHVARVLKFDKIVLKLVHFKSFGLLVIFILQAFRAATLLQIKTSFM